MAGYPTAGRNQILAEVGGVLTADYTAAIGLVVDPSVTGWRKHLGYTTAIEYYVRAAAACCASDAAAPDLLDAVVAVGKAHTFAGLLHPDVVAAPVAALTPEQETAQWERMQPLLADIDWQQITAYVGSWHRPASRSGRAARSATTSSSAGWSAIPRPRSPIGWSCRRRSCWPRAVTTPAIRRRSAPRRP